MLRMKWMLWTAVLALAIVPAVSTMAEDQPAGGEKPVLKGPDGAVRPQRSGRQFDGGRRRGGDRLTEVLAKLNLTDAQKKQVEQITADAQIARQDYMQAHAAELEAARKAMGEARQSGDQAKVQAAREQMAKLMEAGPSPKDTLAKISAVLTAEQKEQFTKAMAEGRRGEGAAREVPGKPMLEAIDKLDATPEVKAQAKKIVEDHMAAMKKVQQENAEAVKAARTRMQDARRSGNEEEMKAARQQMESLLQSAAVGRSQVTTELAKVLNETQMQQLKQLMQENRPRREGMGGPEGPRQRPADGQQRRQPGQAPAGNDQLNL